MKKRISISWSGGKDSAMMLQHIMQDDQFEIVELHTAISSSNDRVSMHGISKELIQAQADSIGYPITFLSIPPSSTNNEYEKALNKYYSSLYNREVYHIGFGDIFLEDLKAYRDQILEANKLKGVYPLWKQNTKQLIDGFLSSDFKTIICAANTALFQHSICGRMIDDELVNSFERSVDPCGENGEFHTFVYQGPIFKSPIKFKIHDSIRVEYPPLNVIDSPAIFEFADLQLA
ncbi:MAG: ATP-binding protein [Reichenbachiella sp.]